MDARQRRSRDKLRSAILTLAAETSADDIAVSQVAAAAGVNRSTFYEHASSPSALLETVLREELDALRTRFLAGTAAQDAAAAVGAVTRSVIQHMERYRAIYLLGLDENSGPASLHPMLAGHFEASIRLLFAQQTISIESPRGETGLQRPVLLEMATRLVADGSVGAIAAWLRSPAPRSIEEFLAAYERLLPQWFPFER